MADRVAKGWGDAGVDVRAETEGSQADVVGAGPADGRAEPQSELSELSGVQIAVRAAEGIDGPGEWTMVELQGTVETGKAPLPGLEVGELTVLPGVRAPARARAMRGGVS